MTGASSGVSNKTKRMFPSEVQMDEISQRTQRQQILGSWSKAGNAASHQSHNVGGKRLRTPQYQGGCYGTPNRNDAKRAESFARYVRNKFVLEFLCGGPE